MRKFFAATFCLVLSVTTFAQQNNYIRPDDTGTFKRIQCTGYYNTDRIKYIREGRTINIFLHTDSLSEHRYSGQVFINDSSLVVLGATEIYHGYSEGESTYIERITTYRKSEFIKIPDKDIDYVSFTPHVHAVFSTLFGVSLASTILLVPLAAVSYSGNINSEQVIMGTASTAIVTFLMSKLFQERKFRIRRAHKG